MSVQQTDWTAARVVRKLRDIAAKDYTETGDHVFRGASVIEDQERALDRVRELHASMPVQFEDFSVCAECSTQTWPCATIRTLNGTRIEEEQG